MRRLVGLIASSAGPPSTTTPSLGSNPPRLFSTGAAQNKTMAASGSNPLLRLSPDTRLSPRCYNGSTSSLSSSWTSRSPFGLSRQPSVCSGQPLTSCHGRQSSSTSAELSQYLPTTTSPRHSRQNSCSNHHDSQSPPRIPPRRPFISMTSPHAAPMLKLSPNSIDMGYHTMVTTTESPPPFREPPPPAPPTQLILEPQQLRVSYKKKSPFDLLSDDLLVRIFKFLPKNHLGQCAQVCRRFYFLAWEPQLWQSIDLQVKNNCDGTLQVLLKHLSRDVTCSQSVLKVCLNNSSGLTDKGIRILAQHCPNLRHFSVHNCKTISNAGIQSLLDQCPSLSHLDLTGCSSICTVSPVQSLKSSTSNTINLQWVDLSDCGRLMDAGLHLMAKNSPHLRHLYLRRCINITDMGIKYLTSFCLHLKELSLSDCAQITDFGLYELAKLGPNLRYLSVAKCDQISDAGVKQIARLCYKLRYLNVRGCEAVSDESMEVIARSCRRLKSLDIGKCDVTDIGLKLLAEHCLGLRKLSIKSCEMISDVGLHSVAYNLKGLQQLNIQDCPVSLEGYRIVKKFCQQCIIEHTNPGFY